MCAYIHTRIQSMNIRKYSLLLKCLQSLGFEIQVFFSTQDIRKCYYNKIKNREKNILMMAKRERKKLIEFSSLNSFDTHRLSQGDLCISDLLLHNKFPQNLVIQNDTHLLPYSVCRSGFPAQLRWMVCFMISQEATITGSARIEVSSEGSTRK